MKILLAIPSKNRVEILRENTWKWASLLSIKPIVFIEPQDWDKYQEFPDVKQLPENNKGLGYAKQFIKRVASAENYDLVFKLDDDIKSFTDYRTRLDPAQTAGLVERIIKTAIETFEHYESIKAVAFPYSFEMYDKKGWQKTKRIQSAYIIRTASMLDDPRINVFEDFAEGLNILAKGGAILKYCPAGIELGIKVGGGTGGHQSYDRLEQAKKEVAYLREIYPPLKFKKVKKSWGIEPDLRSVKL